MAAQNQGDLFETYFNRADLDRDGRISGAEAVAFFQGSNLPKQVLAQIWMYADQNRTGYLGKAEFYNALKLVTVAQSKRDLTPEIVKSALYGPASAKIPAPQINLAGVQVSQTNAAGTAPPASQIRAVAPTMSQNLGSRGPPASPTASMNLQYNQTPESGLVNPANAVGGAARRPIQGVVSQGLPQSPLGSNQPDFRGSSGAGGTSAAGIPQARLPERGNTALTTQAVLPSGTPVQVTSLPTKPPMTSGMTSSGISAMQPKQPVSQNGFASGFGGDAFSAATPQAKKESSVPSSAGGVPVSSAVVPVSGSTQSPSKLSSLGSGPNSFIAQPAGGQPHIVQSQMKHNQQVPVQNMPPSGPRAGSPHTSAGHQPQMQWPRPSPNDLQKYTKVFMEVDTDKDGKITGEQARNLFLSWRLPREVLKQVWDLSDQDNDSMLSLREFCIALYLMERYREGRPLPAMLPSNIMHDFPATAQQTGGYGNAAWGYSPGLQQPSMPGSARPPRPAGKPPLPVPAPSPDEKMPPKQQRPKVPELEKHLVDQLSEEEQKSLNLKFEEASEANKKVEELEKEIKESREKMEFYRVKMQELVLYKSRCDSRYNEISERAAMDKNEVESLANKYEEKYRQSGDVASKLTIEEATFRDIQEKKMEVYQAIVKLEHDGSAEDLQARADRIQSNTEELMKSLNERCKKYGLRGKPTTLLELPFGWQPGIQEGAADWDEVWDKFEDEGFAFVKELTLDVQNVIAPPRIRTKVVKKEKNLGAESETAVPTADAESKRVKPATKDEQVIQNGVIGNQKEDDQEGSPIVSPSARSSHENVHDEHKGSQIGKTLNSDSPRGKGTHSDLGVGDHPSFSGDKSFDEPAWGTFDTSDDANSVTSFSKEIDRDKHADDLFGHGGWTLPPIKTGLSLSGGFLPKLSVFADSVPGTPADGFLPKKSIFADSVPGTPADGFLPNKSIFADSVPGTPADGFLPKKSIFADSVPSTPLYNSSYSPQKSGDGPEERGFNFSRFDSFGSIDSGFNPQERLSRFDSFSSTRDFDSQDGASFQQKETFSRFDSRRSSTDFDYGHRFSSFDDSDPFGSGPFKSSFGSETPRREDAFGSSEPFRPSLGSETPRSEVDPFGSVGPFRSSLASETPRANSDPFGSVGPFRSSFGSENPRADADPFGSVGPFGSSVGSETPRRESDYFGYSGSFKSSYGNETPRSEFDSFGFGGPFGSSLGSETPRHDKDAFGSAGPFRSTWGSETPKGGTDSWSAF